ncbi:DeoR/GlpR family DNA-binding transcription regulator [Phytoactinopolyspora mesophila]|uniref:Lactose phosphotransferase system repressor n=1 Tax=Phytoactinopolyspora mesophila TaxID=2650750 RepID=A0A7K3MCU7_9ACTN|nr:DeoR/GlpR family DNA-binding transcription regulator [Phytoactinopolyspora mesophila]NDL60877.1 DeoR family transcriptional regulator [Phytoactinopolyspora mesophila]
MTANSGGKGAPSKRTQAREVRQQNIIAHVLANGVATAGELTELTGASLMTVHRDLDELARRGVVRKFHGGVSAQPSTVFESSSEYRLRVQVREKTALAEAALSTIEPGMSIMLDTSTTNLFVARRLGSLNHGPLTVATNYLPIMETLRSVPDVHLIGIGGDYNSTHDAFLGMGAIEAINTLNVDLAFLSTSAMTADTTYHQEPEIVMVKRAMMEAGRRRVLLMDHTKIGRTALHRLGPTTDFHQLIVDAAADQGIIREISETLDVTLTQVMAAPRHT